MRKSGRRLDNRRVRSCCGHVLLSGSSRHVVSQSATAKIFADRCIAYKFLANQRLPKPDNYGPYGQNSRPWRSFCNGTAVGGQKKVVENRGNHLGFVMSHPFKRGRSQMVSDRPGGGDPRTYPVCCKCAPYSNEVSQEISHKDKVSTWHGVPLKFRLKSPHFAIYFLFNINKRAEFRGGKSRIPTVGHLNWWRQCQQPRACQQDTGFVLRRRRGTV